MAIETLDPQSGGSPAAARRFYRVKEAAAILGIPVRTLYHLAETEQIPSRRLGNVILLPVAWVDSEPPLPRRR